MKKVLIPLDDSEFSRSILPHVQDLFDPRRWEVVLFRAARAPNVPSAVGHPMPPQQLPNVAGGDLSARGYTRPQSTTVPQPVYADEVWETFRETLEHELAPDVERLKGMGYAVGVAVHYGEDPSQEIARFAEDAGVAAVAMATHGRTGLGRLLRGSVAERVLHQLSIPVLLLRGSEEPVEERPATSPKGKDERGWETIRMDWPQYQGSAKAMWRKLSGAELEIIAGDRERLLSKLQDAYGMSREDAEREVETWRRSLT